MDSFIENAITSPKDEFSHPNSFLQKNNSIMGKVIIGVTGMTAIAITVVTLPFVSPAIRKYCLPFVPATNQQVRNVMLALSNRTGKVIDLGSGDGRIVLESARNNFESHGVELNPWLVAYSRLSGFRSGLSSKVKFYKKDLWTFKLESYNNVVIFGVEQMMQDLEKKLVNECKNSCNIIACRFPLPTLQPQKIIGNGLDTVWVYDLGVNRNHKYCN